MRVCMIALVALIVQGCACTDEGRWAILVRVQDSVTGEQITSTPTAILTDGEYRDTLEASPSHVLIGGDNRPGTYDVEVRAEGYQVWKKEDVKVREAGWCSKLQTVELTAKMVRLTPTG